jgi:hypothetical protein
VSISFYASVVYYVKPKRTGNAGGDDDDVGILHGSLSAIILGQVASNFL